MYLTVYDAVFLLQALPHVGLLIVMLFFIYAVIGMQVSLTYLVSLSCLNVLSSYIPCYILFSNSHSSSLFLLLFIDVW